MTILEDDHDLKGGGVYTPASLGQGFLDRMGKAGIPWETKTISSKESM
jgi:short subunit dehydrogenase-like uncharacterized protein